MDFYYKFTSNADKHVGKTRSANQDEYIKLDDCAFFAVSDGMGGLLNGGETSEMVVEKLAQIIPQLAEENKDTASLEELADKLKAAIVQMAEEIYTVGLEQGTDRYGATLSGVWLVGDSAIFVNVGDSRGYLLRDGELTQVTKDHNLAAYLVVSGDITKEESRDHPSASRLLKYIGMKPPVGAEVFIQPIQPLDEIIICSDGLHGMLYDEEILKHMTETEDKEQTAQSLIDAANEAGGKDNISVVHIVIT